MFNGLNNKTTNGGVNAQGKLSSAEWNAFINELISELEARASNVIINGIVNFASNSGINLGSIIRSVRVNGHTISSSGDGIINLDLSDYYTKEEVDAAIAGATPEIDLSDYYTKSEIRSMLVNKFGAAVYRQGTIYFYDEDGGTVIGSVTLSGTIYNISIATNVEPIFSVLTGDTNKYITITPSTKAGAIGEESVDFTENYTYIVAIDTGSGYINRFNGNITSGGSATFDIRSFLAVGTNRIRISVTGTESGQTKTSILTATLTSLMLNCSHTWYTPWYENQDYVINNIYFSGSIQKTLHVKLGDTEWTKTYRANENYATIATNYTIPASAFPAALESGVHTVEIWMTGEGVSTEHISFNIMCLQDGDTTPLICINNVATAAVNFTQATLFSFATINATSVEIASSVSADGTHVLPSQTLAVEDGQVYTFATALEVDTEAEDGTLTATATAIKGDVTGISYGVTMPLDNSLAFLATSGAKIYINEALRANTESDRESLRNTAQNAEVTDYPMITSGFTWSTDGHATDPEGHKAFVVPAGCSIHVPTLSPMTLMGEQGMTLEFMVRSRNIADYDTPLLSFVTANASDNVEGVLIYPTQITVLGTQERSEVLQSCGLCEDSITHICIVLQKNYSGTAGRNLASVYINGIPNISFSFGSTSTFGSGGLMFGQEKTDGYLYMLRAYDFPLEGQMVKANFLNAIIDGVEFDRALVREKDNILDGATVAYDLVKALGYNCMVIEPDNDGDNIPSFVNQTTIQCSVRFEYWGVNPLWNVLIKHVPLDGQGTTSKKYYRWNLRGKFAKTCEWYYSDGNGDYQTVAKFTGKKGYMDGGENGQAHLKIDRFTAKKNIASSPQGHKMGACAMYDDVFAQMGLKAHMPNANWRIAVWQYPFLGFRKYSNGTYEFIGLYTAGPDKGCKSSFGYDGETYPACMCIEGPNHDPRGTRFLHPWVDVDYDYNNEETLTIGGQEAWDCDFCQYETKYVKEESAEWNAQNKANILALYETEWRPAYDLVYHCSQWIESLADTGYASVAAINADINNFLRQSTNGVSNMLLSFYDSNYNIVYYRTSTGMFDTLIREDNDAQDGLWNIRTYLSTYLTTSTPTTAQIKAARRAKFRAEWSNYFDVDSTLAHRNYTLLTGAKDNDAKNSYPFKHLSLAQGGRWMWKQDDLDSILKTDNNGQGTVKYSVEPGDLNNGVQIFQGCDSSLWNLIWVEFQTELRNNMVAMCSAMETIARSKGIAGQYLHESVYNLMAYYFFTNSAKYFPITAYQEDRKYGYIEPWFIDPTQAYNGVYPLTQALGDRYQEERLWIERRIVYVFSKYRIGAFSGQNAGWGEMSFTLAANMPFTFNITPAIDLYPVANAGGSEQGDVQGARTMAGGTTQITLQSSGATTNYIKGVDWLQSLGDLSGLVLTSRGGSSEVNFSVVSKRMQTLKVGDADPANVLFNATSLTVSGECFEVIDARNVTTLTNSIDLSGCPRLRKALFGGSTATGMLLPEGSRVNEVSFPDALPTLFLHSLGSLTQANMTLSAAARATVIGYYFNRCAQLNPISVLQSIVDTTGNVLGYVTMIWDGVMEITTADVQALVKLSQSTYGSVTYIDGVIANDGNTAPVVRGAVHIEGITEQDYDILVAAFPYLTINYDKKNLSFEDRRVWEICCYNWGETYNLQEVNGEGGVVDAGTLEANGDTLVYSDHVFCSSQAIAKHGDIPATSASAHRYRIEITVEGGRALDGVNAPWDIATASAVGNAIFYPVQYSSAMAAVALGTITAENWADSAFWAEQTILQNGSEAGKYIATVTTTTAAQYLRLGIRAVAGTSVSYKIVSLDVTKMPQGITLTQCQAVTSLSTKFRGNTLITNLNFLNSFTGFYALPDNCFTLCTSLVGEITLPAHITSLGGWCFRLLPNITNINLPNVSSFGRQCFGFPSPGGYISLKEAHFGNLTKAGYFSFQNYAALKLFECGPSTTMLCESLSATSYTTPFNNILGTTASAPFKLVIHSSTPPQLGKDGTLSGNKTFDGTSYYNIYVPDSAVETYKAHSQWSNFASHIKPMSEYPNPNELIYLEQG